MSMDDDSFQRLVVGIAVDSATAILRVDGEPIEPDEVGNCPETVVLLALDAYRQLGEPVPPDLMTRILLAMNEMSDEELWNDCQDSGLLPGSLVAR